jgi:hypothetical protein
MGDREERYLSYLLRLWQTTSGGKLAWRASLEDARTGKRRGFSCLDDLVAFLCAQVDETAERPGSTDDSHPERRIERV